MNVSSATALCPARCDLQLTLRLWVRRLLPFTIALAVLTAMLRKYALHEILQRLRGGHAVAMLGPAVALPLVYWIINVAADWWVLRCTLGHIRFTEVLAGKAGTSVLTAIGYLFSNGGYAVWIARKTHSRAQPVGGIALYLMISDLAAVCLVALGGMFLGHVSVPRSLEVGAAVIAGTQLVAITFAPWAPKRLSQRLTFLRPWAAIPRGVGLGQLLGRCINVALAVCLTSLGARVFGLTIPSSALAAYVPVALLVESLPVNIAGLGALQGAWLMLFLKWAPGPQLLAFQFLWQLVKTATIIARGLPFLRRTASDIEAAAASSAAPP